MQIKYCWGAYWSVYWNRESCGGSSIGCSWESCGGASLGCSGEI